MALALAVTVSFILLEVGAAFKWQGDSLRRILCHRAALWLYAGYGAVTLAAGLFLRERGFIHYTFCEAIVLGLAVPQLLHLNLRFFSPIHDEGTGFHASLNKYLSNLRQFCYLRIRRSLRLEEMENLEVLVEHLDQEEPQLLQRLKAVSSPEEYAHILELVEERRRLNPQTVKAFLVLLLERYDPEFARAGERTLGI